MTTIVLKGASKYSIKEPTSILVPVLFLLLYSSAGSGEKEAVALSPSPGRGWLRGKARVVAPSRDKEPRTSSTRSIRSAACSRGACRLHSPSADEGLASRMPPYAIDRGKNWRTRRTTCVSSLRLTDGFVTGVPPCSPSSRLLGGPQAPRLLQPCLLRPCSPWASFA